MQSNVILHTNLEFTSLCHIFNPLERLIFLPIHIQPIHFQPRNGHLSNIEVYIYSWIRVEISGAGRDGHGSSNIGQFRNVNAPYIPMEKFLNRVESVFSLVDDQQTVHRRFRHANLQLYTLDASTKCCLWSHGDIHLGTFSRLEGQHVPNVNWNCHNALRTNVVGHETEIAVGWNEG